MAISRSHLIHSRGIRVLDLSDPINQGLIGYWRMDGGTISGTTIADLSVNGFSGTLVGSPKLTVGRTGQALSLDGSTQWITLPDGLSAAVSGGSAVSMMGWFKGSNAQSLIRFQPGGAYLVLTWGNSPPSCIISTDGGAGGGLAFSTSITDGAWHHLAMTWQQNVAATGFSVFVDGKVFNARTSVNAALPVLTDGSTGDVWLGEVGANGSNNELLHGSIDECRVYRRALSPSEIFRIYSDTSGNLGWTSPARSRLWAPTGFAQVVGSVIQTQVDQTAALAGSVADRLTLTGLQADQTSTLAGSIADRASLDVPQADQMGALAGAVADRGALIAAQDDQITALAGTVSNRAALAETQADQAALLSGIVAFLTIHGVLAYTQTDQTARIVGTSGARVFTSPPSAFRTIRAPAPRRGIVLPGANRTVKTGP